ncbi:Lysozyme 2 [Gryllus bimaculatus]|nr:Lysozyme 2 [Gryllus bimaculatus]
MVLWFALLVLLGAAGGKVLNNCDLAKELKETYKFPEEQISTWVCIAKHQSNFNTSAKGILYPDGTRNLGLWGINNRRCNSESYHLFDRLDSIQICNVTCDKFLDDNISDDVECIKKIYAENMKRTGEGDHLNPPRIRNNSGGMAEIRAIGPLSKREPTPAPCAASYGCYKRIPDDHTPGKRPAGQVDGIEKVVPFHTSEWKCDAVGTTEIKSASVMRAKRRNPGDHAPGRRPAGAVAGTQKVLPFQSAQCHGRGERNPDDYSPGRRPAGAMDGTYKVVPFQTAQCNCRRGRNPDDHSPGRRPAGALDGTHKVVPFQTAQ